MSDANLIELIEAVKGLSVTSSIDIATVVIAVVNLGVLILTAVYFYKKQVDIMKEQAGIMKEQSEVAKTQADLMHQQNKISLYREKYTIYLEVTEFLNLIRNILLGGALAKKNPELLKNELLYQIQIFMIRYNKSKFDLTNENWRSSEFISKNEELLFLESYNLCFSYLEIHKKIEFVYAENDVANNLEELVYLSACIYDANLNIDKLEALKKLEEKIKVFDKKYLPILEERLKL